MGPEIFIIAILAMLFFGVLGVASRKSYEDEHDSWHEINHRVNKEQNNWPSSFWNMPDPYELQRQKFEFERKLTEQQISQTFKMILIIAFLIVIAYFFGKFNG